MKKYKNFNPLVLLKILEAQYVIWSILFYNLSLIQNYKLYYEVPPKAVIVEAVS